MKKLLIGLLVLGSFSSFATEVVILKVSASGHSGHYGLSYGDRSKGGAMENAQKACTDIGGTISRTVCDSQRVNGTDSTWSLARACAVTCSID